MLAWRDRLLSSFRAADPELAARALLESKPDIVRNCPGNFYEFVEGLRQKGFKIDNHPFRWEGFEYLIDPYKSIHYTGQQNPQGIKQTIMAGAQVAKTTTLFLLLVHQALYFWGRYLGIFYPVREMSDNYSAERFKPMVQGIPEIRPLWGVDPLNTEEKRQTDKKSIRTIGASKIIFSYLEGRISTEGWPLLMISFDEVRRMLDSLIELATERLSHSDYPGEFLFSTAGFPDVNIDRAFKQSNQNKFHTKCRCTDGVLLSEVFPDCIGTKTPGMTPAFKDLPDHFYVCPMCHEVILNPRIGQWVPHRPSEKFHIGWHIPQTLSCAPKASPGAILKSFMEARNIQEFYNSKLGVAYLAKESRIVDEAILRATVNYDLKWKKTGVNCSMGIDQMSQFNVVVVREKGPVSGMGLSKSRLVHLEIVYSDDPWQRCAELMSQYDVSICVADALPNSNEAVRFAKAFPGRVFLSEYNYTPEKGTDNICSWGDRPTESATERKASTDTKNKFKVHVNRYLAIEWNLMKYANRLKEQPHERGLVMDVKEERGNQATTRKDFICENVFWTHLQKVARIKEEDEETGEIKMQFVNLGIDPHFLHADLYAELALSRLKVEGGGAFSDYAAAAQPKDNAHQFVQDAVHLDHWKCIACGITVGAPLGTSPQEIADKSGYAECPDAKK